MAINDDFILKMHDYNKIVRKGFFFEYSIAHRFAALNYLLNGKEPSVSGLKDVKAAIKENTGLFSQFRGMMFFSLTALIDSSFSDGTNAAKKVVDAMDKLKDAGFKTSEYLPLCAFSLEKNSSSSSDYETIPKRALELYSMMKKHHPLLTSREDYLLSILMALIPDQTADELGYKMEEHYKALNAAGFKKGNQLQFMSHILTLDKGDPQLKAQKCAEIRDSLHKNNIRVSVFGDSSLALLTLMSMRSQDIVDKAIEYCHALKKTKGFRTIGKYERLLHATALAGHEISTASDFESITGLTIQTMILAQQIAIMAAIVVVCASTTAATSAS